jgi:hypothetical protein
MKVAGVDIHPIDDLFPGMISNNLPGMAIHVLQKIAVIALQLPQSAQQEQ